MNLYRDIPTLAELERAYSPSSCVESLDALLAEYAQRSADVRAARPDMRSLAYGTHAEEALDFFPAPGAEDGRARPVVLFIHGGYWQALGKRDHSFPAPGFGAQGLHYIALNYGLAPDAPLDRLVERCCMAIDWVVAQAGSLGIDPHGVHVSGSSAGAHLATMAAMADWPARGHARHPIRTLALLGGVYDLRPIPLTYVNAAVGLTADDALRLSPLLRLDAGAFAFGLPPMLVAAGRHETAEFHRQSADFALAAQRRGVQAESVVVEGRNHFDVVHDLADVGTPLGTMVAMHMRRPAAEHAAGDAR